ncbi:MAG: hypothetical protein MJ157_06155, partial [Clostridia bacterium]|nr:hypothetical protein [Clostridia bacterium]
MPFALCQWLTCRFYLAAGYGFGDFASGPGYDGSALNKVDAFLGITDAAKVEDIKNVYVTGVESTYIDANDGAESLVFGDLTGTQLQSNWV